MAFSKYLYINFLHIVFEHECINFSTDVILGHTGLHGLRTPNEGINQRNLKNWADVGDKICFGRT